MSVYAPVLESVPAFTSSADGEQVRIKVKYNDNIAVTRETPLRLRAFTLSEGQTVFEESLTCTNPSGYEAIFITSSSGLTSGQYYKFQIAYHENNIEDSELAWSSVVVGRYIGEAPRININGYESDKYNSAALVYQGSYSHSFERLYKYKIDLVGVDSTDWQLYKENEPIQLITGKTLQTNQKYEVQYSILTVNGYEATQSIWVQADLIPKTINGILSGIPINEFGYIDVIYNGNLTKSNYLLLRCKANTNYWEKITEFYVSSSIDNVDNLLIYRDMTIEQGVAYYYAIQEFTKDNDSNNFYTGQKLSTTTAAKAEFEDIVLSDGERALVVKFNPKVSSLKETILEAKKDTIGGKYPIFFRNSDVRYKEIPISGLISYQLDNNYLFMNEEELGISKNLGSNLTGENFAAERKFKLAVLEWLNNGKPKIFRSAAEGNYIVRLMNVSLSPNDTLGRMLHTFQATAYECAEFNDTNLVNLNLLNFYNNTRIKNGTNTESEVIFPGGSKTLSNVSNIECYISNPNLNSSILTIDGQPYKVPSGYFATPAGNEYSEVICENSTSSSIILNYKQNITIVFGKVNNAIINSSLINNADHTELKSISITATTEKNYYSHEEGDLILGAYLTALTSNSWILILPSYREVRVTPGTPIYYLGEDLANIDRIVIPETSGAQMDIVYRAVKEANT